MGQEIKKMLKCYAAGDVTGAQQLHNYLYPMFKGFGHREVERPKLFLLPMPLNDDEAISLKYYQEMAFLLLLSFFLLC